MGAIQVPKTVGQLVPDGPSKTAARVALGLVIGTDVLAPGGSGAGLTGIPAGSALTGTVAIANGGTGQATATAAINALLPSQASASGKFLSSDGTNTSWAVASGSGANALGSYIVQTSTNAPSNAQVLGSLATGIVKNTTTTGVLSIAVAGTDYLSPSGNGSGLTSLTAGNLSGTVALANGGTGQTSASAAINALVPSQGSQGGKFLQTNGTVVSWGVASGSGADALGSYIVQTATNAPGNAQVLASLATGLLKNTTSTGVLSIAAAGTDYLSPTGNGSGLTSLTAANLTGTVAIANGGTGQTSANAALNALLPTQASNSGKVLTTDATNTSWATPIVYANALGTYITQTATNAPANAQVLASLSTGLLKVTTTTGVLTTATAGTDYLTPTGNGSGLTSLTAGNLSGTVALANGGTGQTSAANAINALVPSQTGNNTKVLGTNGTVVSWVAQSGGGGSAVIATYTGNTTLTNEDWVIADTTSGPITLTMPNATTATKPINIIAIGSGSNLVSVASVSSQTFAGVASPATFPPGNAFVFVPDGSNWQVA